MLIDSSLIGTHSAPHTFRIEAEAVQRFMEATEDPALQGNASRDYVPPTFPTTFRVPITGLELDMSKLQLLHGEQSYTYSRPLRIGEQLSCVARITDIRERAGRTGAMTFIVRELIATDSEHQHVFTARGTSIVRAKK